MKEQHRQVFKWLRAQKSGNITNIADYLGCTHGQALRYVRYLQNFGYVKKRNSRWELTQDGEEYVDKNLAPKP